MRIPKMFFWFYFWLCLILTLGCVSAQANFEDVDSSNEYLNQNFDLRHTIPGEPGVDYPILSIVPKTSFKCTGRHEGYYADMESRCQAFRICAHTARTVQGFGFLCPNGTLFNQKHFVCDWYRNVNCDESERFYAKNSASRVGSKQDMMERVRQIMEYPMKTISQALQQTKSSAKRPPSTQYANDQTTLNTNVNSPAVQLPKQKTAVTRAEIESAYNYVPQSAPTTSGAATPSATSNGEVHDDVYVNSLGELSTDPETNFDRTNAHIIAEYPRVHHINKQMNFAARVNSALNEHGDSTAVQGDKVLAPEYIKNIRNTNDEATQLDLISNINGLLEEVSTDLDPSFSGYQSMAPTQKIKQPFRFLSRGFAAQNERGKHTPYEYVKPKQTPSTIRFTPNEIPIDITEEHKNTQEQKLEQNFEQENYENVDLNLENATVNETTTTETPKLEIVEFVVPASDNELNAAELENTLNQLRAPIIIEDFGVEETTDVPSIADSEKLDVEQRAANLLLAGVKLTAHNEQPDSEKIDTQNENLPEEQRVKDGTIEIASTQPVTEVTTTTTTTTTTTSPATTTKLPTTLLPRATRPTRTTPTPKPSPNTTEMSTSTETITEINSVQERIRGYRRYSQKQRATAKSKTAIYAQRANVRTLQRTKYKPTTSTTPTTPTTPPTTTKTTNKPTVSRTYLRRVEASRLRLSRLSTSTTTTTTPSTTTTTTKSPNEREQENNTKYQRNIDKETGNVNSLLPAEPHEATWESVRNNLKRFQVNRGSYTYASRTTTETPTTTTTASSAATTRNTQTRQRNRFSNFKTQTVRMRGTTTAATTPKSTTAYTTIKTTAVATTKAVTTAAAATRTTTNNNNNNNNHNLASQLTLPAIQLLANSYTHKTAPHNTATTTTHTQTSNSLDSITSTQALNPLLSAAALDNTQQQQLTAKPVRSTIQTSASHSLNTSPNTFLSFDKLTQSIVDGSILQNFKSNHAQQTSNNYQSNNNIVTAKANTGTGYTYSRGANTPAKVKAPQTPAQTPAIVIARAEGQRIQPNSVDNVIATLTTAPQQQQQQQTTRNSYESLSEFLNKKFGTNTRSQTTPAGAGAVASANVLTKQTTAPAAYSSQGNTNNNVHAQAQPQQQLRQQQQQLSYITQQYQQQQQQQPAIAQQQQQQQQRQQQTYIQLPYQNTYTHTLQQQQPQQQQQQVYYQTQHNPFAAQQQQHLSYQQLSPQQQQQQQNKQTAHTSSLQQPYLAPNILINYQQHQQQLPQFPPLASAPQHQQQQLSTASRGISTGGFLNVKLPALPTGLIPAPTFQIAQRRSDNEISTTATHWQRNNRYRALYSGATSYDVPLSSIGRLPNDRTHVLRRRQRKL